MNWFFTSDGQSIGASTSASVLPMNIQDWFPSGLIDLISLLSRGLSGVFSNTTVGQHQFFSTQPSLWCNSQTSIHDYWKNHCFDYMGLCWQSDVSCFLICCLGDWLFHHMVYDLFLCCPGRVSHPWVQKISWGMWIQQNSQQAIEWAMCIIKS